MADDETSISPFINRLVQSVELIVKTFPLTVTE